MTCLQGRAGRSAATSPYSPAADRGLEFLRPCGRQAGFATCRLGRSPTWSISGSAVGADGREMWEGAPCCGRVPGRPGVGAMDPHGTAKEGAPSIGWPPPPALPTSHSPRAGPSRRCRHREVLTRPALRRFVLPVSDTPATPSPGAAPVGQTSTTTGAPLHATHDRAWPSGRTSGSRRLR